MTDPGYSVHIVETRTGTIVLNELPILGTPQFIRQINDDGSIQIQIPVGDAGVPPASKLRQLVTAWRDSLAVCIGGTLLPYSPIIPRKFGQPGQVLTGGAGSLWAPFN